MDKEQFNGVVEAIDKSPGASTMATGIPVQTQVEIKVATALQQATVGQEDRPQ